MRVSQTLLVSYDLDSLEESGQVFCRMADNWSVSAVFLILRVGWWVTGRKTTGVKCHFIPSFEGDMMSACL